MEKMLKHILLYWNKISYDIFQYYYKLGKWQWVIWTFLLFATPDLFIQVIYNAVYTHSTITLSDYTNVYFMYLVID